MVVIGGFGGFDDEGGERLRHRDHCGRGCLRYRRSAALLRERRREQRLEPCFALLLEHPEQFGQHTCGFQFTMGRGQQPPQTAPRFAQFGEQLGGGLTDRLRLARQFGQIVPIAHAPAAETDARMGHAFVHADQADLIHAEVCSRSYDSELGHFVSSYGSRDLDASLLLIGQSGFLAPDDERVARTVEAVRRHLSVDGLVLRYQPHPDYDGVEDDAEGAFLACSYWMVDALAGAKRTDEAVALFEQLLSLRNDLGLLAEEWDVASGQLAGNFPQAFSHLGLISSAANLAGAKASRIFTRRSNRRERLRHPSAAAVGGVTVAEQGEHSAPVVKQLAFSAVDDCATSWEYEPSTRRSSGL